MKTFQNLYDRKDYRQALNLLTSEAGNLSPELFHYNLGITLFQMGRLPEARFHFLMAEENGFQGDGLTNNQVISEEKLELSHLESPINISDYFVKGALELRHGYYTFFSLIIILIGLFILKKKPTFNKLVLWTILSLLPLSMDFWVDSWDRRVVIGDLPLSNGPSSIFLTERKLPPGLMVIVRGNENWKKIIFPSRFEGWITSDGLKKVEKL